MPYRWAASVWRIRTGTWAPLYAACDDARAIVELTEYLRLQPKVKDAEQCADHSGPLSEASAKLNRMQSAEKRFAVDRADLQRNLLSLFR